MQPRILLRLIAAPTLVSSMLAIALLPAQASGVKPETAIKAGASCDVTKAAPHKPGEIRSTKENGYPAVVNIPVEYPALDLTAAESDAAVALFGCDCPACLNTLQQLRRQPLLTSGQGHCLTAMLDRVSAQEIQTVLQALEAEEAN
jgi:hypothetical protein